MSNVFIRNYTAFDREAVRTICIDTADRGEPIDRFFSDRECAADLLTKYYTDYEPASIFTAVADGRVVGYVFGCFDNRRYGLVMLFIILPLVLIKGFKRGLFFERQTWHLILGMLKNCRRLFAWRKESFHSHQGHMHIGIARGFRGQRIGGQLTAALLDFARAQGVEEITASVHDSNHEACRFFEYLNFVVKERYPMVVWAGNNLEHYHSVLYVKKIS